MDAVDRQFTRWRDTGDLEALAAVYDTAAPALLRLALHHVRQPATAEDLVQTTFLAAIHNARTYDPARPLLGWLVGILANQAKWLQRREGRAIDAGRLHGAAPRDPLAAAAASEFTAQCDAAIEGLPEAYRPVLRLHLKHELLAAEIAHVLGRPSGTVRSQITRGLELLRAALPTGVALTAFAAVLPARGLAAVRGEVLASAKSVSPVAAAAVGAAVGAGLWGSIVMHKLLVGVVAAAAAVLWLAPWSRAVVDAGGARQPVAGQVAATAAADHPAAAAAPTSGAASMAAATEARLPHRVDGSVAATWSLTGLVSTPPGAPGPIVVRVAARFWDQNDELAEVEIGPEGRYQVDLETLRALAPSDLDQVGLVVAVDAAGRGGVEHELELVHRDPSRAMQIEWNVELAMAATVSGRILDRLRQPVAAATVVLQGADGGQLAVGETRRDGRFRLATSTAGSGRVRATHESAGSALQPCDRVIGVDRDLGDLWLGSAHQLQARFVFPDGRPAPGVEVNFVPEGEDGARLASVVTDQDGAVAVATESLEPRWLEVSTLGPDLRREVMPDGASMTVVLDDLRQLRFVCRDAQGRPLRAISAELAAWRATVTNESGPLRLAGKIPRQPDWEAALYLDSLLAPVGTWLLVSAEHRDLRAQVLLQVAPAPNIQEVSMVLAPKERSSELLVRLVAHDGLDVGTVSARLEPLRLGDPEEHRVELAAVADGLGARLHPGRYRLRLSPDYGSPIPGWFQAIEREIDLVAGQVTEIRASAVVGGRLRFVFHLPPGDDQPIRSWRITSPAAWLGWPVDPEMLITASGDHLTAGAPAGQPLRWRPLLPPGRHEVTIAAEGHAEIVIGVEVTARTTTDVHVHLQPR
ncbi:MAG: sigma-70 family RNA polymerase sigma factor [Planctomycetes bacterium]|jgi:RNA polymerase sigma-70 factor (ECF subfamily)|nr:sigma-70 family RNA polymerase sigma factor [Planctomycetota bacterium]